MSRTTACILFLLCPGCATAGSIIWDQSPAAWGGVDGFTAFNVSDAQNFTDAVVFTHDHLLTGVDIYSRLDTIGVGAGVVVRVYSDESGVPKDLLAEASENIVIRDGDGSVAGISRLHAELTSPLLLSADTTYWIGMSGGQQQIGQEFLATDPQFGDGKTAQMFDTGFDFLQDRFGDQAFRLHGMVVPTPGCLRLTMIVMLGAMTRMRELSRRQTMAAHIRVG